MLWTELHNTLKDYGVSQPKLDVVDPKSTAKPVGDGDKNNPTPERFCPLFENQKTQPGSAAW